MSYAGIMLGPGVWLHSLGIAMVEDPHRSHRTADHSNGCNRRRGQRRAVNRIRKPRDALVGRVSNYEGDTLSACAGPQPSQHTAKVRTTTCRNIPMPLSEAYFLSLFKTIGGARGSQ